MAVTTEQATGGGHKQRRRQLAKEVDKQLH